MGGGKTYPIQGKTYPIPPSVETWFLHASEMHKLYRDRELEMLKRQAALQREVHSLRGQVKEAEREEAEAAHARSHSLKKQGALQRELDCLRWQAEYTESEAMQQADALRGQVEALNQDLEDVGCCSICFEGPPAAGFLHGDTVHR
jgi:septal ring factor EnvC (AmiA/AmiB activator)